MKKLLSLALVLALMLTLGVSAFAEIYVDGVSQGLIQEVLVDKAQYVSAGATGDDLTVTGNVAGDGLHNSVYAEGGGEINVGGTVTGNISWGGDAIYAKDDSTKVVVVGTVTEEAGGSAINASSGAAVEVGSVSEDGEGNGVSASSGASVTVEGNVTESGEGIAVNASGAETIVTVNGNVDESGTGSALQAVEATIIVIGNVEEKNAGTAITAANNATVIVGGNVTDGVETAVATDAVSSGFGATVIVEGLVNGRLKTNGTEDDKSGTIYIGALNGEIHDSDFNKIHYLIGVAPEGSAALSAVTLESDIVAAGTIYGVNEKGYKYTTTADKNILANETIILKPVDGGKILTLNNFKVEGVEYKPNDDGTVTLTLKEGFKGGLQNLVLIIDNKPTPGPDPTPVPVIYVVPVGSITVVEFTAPEGIEEGLITKLDSADHAGLTIDKSLLAEGYDHGVKVTMNGEELPEGAYRFVINWDGSLSLILSTTYLKTLGDGSYDFIATVDDLVIPFTVVVAE